MSSKYFLFVFWESSEKSVCVFLQIRVGRLQRSLVARAGPRHERSPVLPAGARASADAAVPHLLCPRLGANAEDEKNLTNFRDIIYFSNHERGSSECHHSKGEVNTPIHTQRITHVHSDKHTHHLYICNTNLWCAPLCPLYG